MGTALLPLIEEKRRCNGCVMNGRTSVHPLYTRIMGSGVVYCRPVVVVVVHKRVGEGFTASARDEFSSGIEKTVKLGKSIEAEGEVVFFHSLAFGRRFVRAQRWSVVAV